MKQKRPTQQKTLRKLPAIGAIAGLTLVAGSSFAYDTQNDKETGWYSGISIGTTQLSNSGVDSAYASQGFTSTSSIDKRDSTVGVNVGYQFNKNFAVEGGYVDLGKYNYNASISAPAADSASGSYKTTGWTTTAVGILPLKDGFSAYGKAGVIFADTKFSANSNTGTSALSNYKSSTTSGTYGLGVSYDISKNIVGKVEWNRYEKLGNSNTGKSDLDAYTVGVAYRF